MDINLFDEIYDILSHWVGCEQAAELAEILATESEDGR